MAATVLLCQHAHLGQFFCHLADGVEEGTTAKPVGLPPFTAETLIAVRFAYEWHDDSGQWFRSYGNENWLFNAQGLMVQRHASINDLPIREADRRFFWPLGRRPDDHPGLDELGL